VCNREKEPKRLIKRTELALHPFSKGLVVARVIDEKRYGKYKF
jgi:hypothetical protein